MQIRVYVKKKKEKKKLILYTKQIVIFIPVTQNLFLCATKFIISTIVENIPDHIPGQILQARKGRYFVTI